VKHLQSYHGKRERRKEGMKGYRREECRNRDAKEDRKEGKQEMGRSKEANTGGKEWRHKERAKGRNEGEKE
jgi:hypothetical protein